MPAIAKALSAALFAAYALLLAGALSHAQSWPQRPVKLILPLGPGSGVDITARLVGERLAAIGASRW
jgi:tripartite-type tricarboxylate transporter receptor subunit TctC